jgi:hypothetical protein
MASGVNFGTQQYFGFDPRTIPGCCLWMDAADARTLTTGGGGKVTQWADKSGVGANMTPRGSFGNATIQANYQNGLSALNFSGFNQYQTPANTGVYPSDVYILVALKSLTRMDVISVGPTNADNFNSLTFAEYSARRWHNGSSSFSRTPATVATSDETSTSLLIMNWSLANNNFIIRRNGTQLSSTSAYTYGPSAGAIIQIGFRHQNFDTNLSFDAYVAEVVTFDRQLADAERQQVEGYLAWKWALQANLPSSHPFRPAPPFMRAFLPVDVSGTALWLDAADASTLTLSGTNVTQCRDKSGQGYVLTVPGGGYTSPVYSNGVLTMSGTNALWSTTNFAISGNTQVTTFLVGSVTSIGNPGPGAHVGLAGSATPPQYFGVLAYQDGGRTILYTPSCFGPDADRTLTPNINGQRYLLCAFYNGTVIQGTYNGTLGTSQSLTTANFAARPFQIGMRNANTGSTNDGTICECICYTGALTAVQRQQVEGYLAQKWGLQGSLPTTHPYYRVLPSTPLFSPPQFSGVAFWLDGADPSSMTLSGSTITQWRDKSVNGYAGTSVGSPLQTTINGLPAVAFNGSQYFDFGDVADLGAANLNIFCVSKFNTTGEGSLIAKSLLGESQSRYSLLREAGSLVIIVQGDGATGQPRVADTNTSFRLLSWTWDRTTQTLYQNGTSILSSAFASTTTFNSAHKLLIGAYNNGSGGTPPYSPLNLNGTIGEILFLFGTLTTIQRQEVEGYLAWKWGLQASLPASHPFAKVRP